VRVSTAFTRRYSGEVVRGAPKSRASTRAVAGGALVFVGDKAARCTGGTSTSGCARSRTWPRSARRGCTEYLPQVDAIRSNGTVDTLRLPLTAGQTPQDVADAAEGLRQLYRALRCTVREDGPGWALSRRANRTRMIQRRETTKVHAGGVVPDLHVSVGSG
jgi:hypothetical protein